MLEGIIAPRGLLVLDNSAIDWLGPYSSYNTATAARNIFEALGAEDMLTFTQVYITSHCMLPQSQSSFVAGNIARFLVGEDIETGGVETDGDFDYNADLWVDWVAPVLE